eukprot:jgi/Chlat1/3712/Chrsp251S00804
MKVKCISRSEAAETRERAQDVVKYVRAVSAAKLERVFARPFVGALQGHADGVSALALHPTRLGAVLSAAHDGAIKLKCVRDWSGHHRGAVTGLSVLPGAGRFVSCGADSTVRVWVLPGESNSLDEREEGGGSQQPVTVFHAKSALRAVDRHRREGIFATAGSQVDVWDINRSDPITTLSWGTDTTSSIRFNTAEPDIFATTSSDRSVGLYDLRTNTAIRKLVMRTKSNAVAWNPREAFNFTIGNEDSNCYTYDMRKLNFATCVHKDHVSAVMDLDYSPSGREFVTGSYDRTVRIFAYNGGSSREVYHAARMQRVFCARFSLDASYIFSGSDDSNVRIWKADAAEQLGTMLPRERARQNYLRTVKERYKHLPEVKRIDRHRHVPKAIYKASRLRSDMAESAKKKEQRVRAHSAPGKVPHVPARKKRIVAELE